MKKRTFIIQVILIAAFFCNSFAQNNHFGRLDHRFLWGVSGGVTLPNGRPSSVLSDVILRPGYDFGLDFRHKLGDVNNNSYFVFLHYGVNMGSFFCSIMNENLGYSSEVSTFFREYEPKFLHLDIPIGIELPLGYFWNNRMSFNVQTTLTSRFYFFSPNQIYNLATTNALAFRVDKFQIQASYSYYFLSQFSKQTVPQYADWKTSEIVVGLKFYF